MSTGQYAQTVFSKKKFNSVLLFCSKHNSKLTELKYFLRPQHYLLTQTVVYILVSLIYTKVEIVVQVNSYLVPDRIICWGL